jgi:hypothetical protein
MWLPMKFAYSRNKSLAKIETGALDSVRLMMGDSQHGNAYPWKTAKEAAADVNISRQDGGLFTFSAACWYFAEALSERLAADGEQIPLGLIDTAIGGSMIEEWTVNSTTATCMNTSNIGAGAESLWTKNVVPYLSMTVKGFVSDLRSQ